jgi:hypothetical protein
MRAHQQTPNAVQHTSLCHTGNAIIDTQYTNALYDTIEAITGATPLLVCYVKSRAGGMRILFTGVAVFT